jgi:pimeloyl-ACP methyl ester carboxylesterase
VTSTSKASQSHILKVRGVRYHVRTWGEDKSPKLVLLHGWMDVSASFQFLVDALQSDWYVIAPDWRGFGLSEWAADGYWFADYIADLDVLLRELAPQEPVNLVGHSMGGNVAGLYAGARPSRIAKLALLEGFGLPRTAPSAAPERYRSPIHRPLSRTNHWKRSKRG